MAKPKKAKRAKVEPPAKPARDWALIRKQYVEGWQNGKGRHMPTMDELGQKHGIRPGDVRRRAARDGWNDDRRIFAAKVQRTREDAAAIILAEAGISVDRRVLALSEGLLDQVARVLSQYMPSDAGPPPLPDALLLQRLAATLVRAHFAAREAIGDNPGLPFEDLGRDPRKRVLIHMVPKPPPGTDDDEAAEAD